MSVQDFKTCDCRLATINAHYGLEQQPTCSITVFYMPLLSKLTHQF